MSLHSPAWIQLDPSSTTQANMIQILASLLQQAFHILLHQLKPPTELGAWDYHAQSRYHVFTDLNPIQLPRFHSRLQHQLVTT